MLFGNWVLKSVFFSIILLQSISCKSWQTTSKVLHDRLDEESYDLVVKLDDLSAQSIVTHQSGIATGANTVITIKMPGQSFKNTTYRGNKPTKTLVWNLPNEQTGFAVLIFQNKLFNTTQFKKIVIENDSLMLYRGVGPEGTYDSNGLQPILQTDGTYLLGSLVSPDKFKRNTVELTGTNRHVYRPSSGVDIKPGDHSAPVIGPDGELSGLLNKVYRSGNDYAEIYLPWSSNSKLESFKKFIVETQASGADFSAMQSPKN